MPTGTPFLLANAQAAYSLGDDRAMSVDVVEACGQSAPFDLSIDPGNSDFSPIFLCAGLNCLAMVSDNHTGGVLDTYVQHCDPYTLAPLEEGGTAFWNFIGQFPSGLGPYLQFGRDTQEINAGVVFFAFRLFFENLDADQAVLTARIIAEGRA